MPLDASEIVIPQDREMPESGSRRRSSDQRNVLYDEPSMFGVLVAIGVIVAVIAVILIVLFGDVLPAGL